MMTGWGLYDIIAEYEKKVDQNACYDWDGLIRDLKFLATEGEQEAANSIAQMSNIYGEANGAVWALQPQLVIRDAEFLRGKFAGIRALLGEQKESPVKDDLATGGWILGKDCSYCGALEGDEQCSDCPNAESKP
jgi:hypothetical protein